MRQNTKRATVITDGQGRTLWTGALRPGRMHDQTAVKTEGIEPSSSNTHRSRPRWIPDTEGAKRFPDQTRRRRRSSPGTRRPRRHCLGEGPQEAILGADMRRARQRRAQAVEAPPAAPRPPRIPLRGPSDHRRPRLRLHRRAVITHWPNPPSSHAATPVAPGIAGFGELSEMSH
jgi:hypothetical protein